MEHRRSMCVEFRIIWLFPKENIIQCELIYRKKCRKFGQKSRLIVALLQRYRNITNFVGLALAKSCSKVQSPFSPLIMERRIHKRVFWQDIETNRIVGYLKIGQNLLIIMHPHTIHKFLYMF